MMSKGEETVGWILFLFIIFLRGESFELQNNGGDLQEKGIL